MKILLVANYLPDAQESMQRFAAALHGGLTERGIDCRLIRPAVRARPARGSNHGLHKWLGYADKFVLFRRQIRLAAEWADVVHVCDHSNALYLPLVSRQPHLITCHDLLAVRCARGEIPGQRTAWSGRVLQQLIVRNLARASRICCVSQATRQDVLRLTGLAPERVSVVHNGLNYAFSPCAPAEAWARLAAFGIPAHRPFLLHVGGNQWYKNREGVLRIFAGLLGRGVDADLVMVGKPWTESMRRMGALPALAGRVYELVGASSEDLRGLYSVARALLFPSLSEGFGWPVIEAQACGCPVIASAITPLQDVAGDAALWVNPHDEGAAAALIASRWSDLGTLREAGLRNAVAYSAESMVEGYLREYELALANECTGASRGARE